LETCTGVTTEDAGLDKRSLKEGLEELACEELPGAFAENVVETATIASIATEINSAAKRLRFLVNNNLRAIV
jgi:hypothetical protein